MYEKFIVEIVQQDLGSSYYLDKAKRRFCKENNVLMPQNDLLLEVYHNLIHKDIISRNSNFEKLLTLKSTRSLSGIVVLSVLTKPYECPGKCLYCPTEKGVPKSYFSNEPAVMRAIACKYDPYLQITSRLKALDAVGHITDKVNVRIIGGAWSYYPKRYQTWFIKEVFRAANNRNLSIRSHVMGGDILSEDLSTIARDDSKLKLVELQTFNETAKHRIVEISIETRQDYIDVKEIKRLRKLGVTKVELGVQTIYDKVLLFNNRGNSNYSTITATKLLKDAGFKVSYQMMLNLPGSDSKNDLKEFGTLFSDQKYQPDHMKIYPMALVKATGAYKLYQDGKYKPYSKEQLVSIISKIKQIVPYYCRIERVIRDIPSNMIVEGGSKCSNLRQEVTLSMDKDGQICHCIRCREIRNNFINSMKWKVFRQDYDSSDGKDIFLSVESLDRKYLISMLRFRIPSYYFDKKTHFIKILNKSALIREIHTYGAQVRLGKKDDFAAQHHGFGTLLVKEAENIAKKEFDLSKIAVISGVGVREFFVSQGYELKDTYMLKVL